MRQCRPGRNLLMVVAMAGALTAAGRISPAADPPQASTPTAPQDARRNEADQPACPTATSGHHEEGRSPPAPQPSPAALVSASAAAADQPSGCAVGATVPAFYVRQLNGPRPNLARCLVCRNGDRPVVMICTRKLDGQVANLLEAVDRTVDAHRAHGLRAFALFLDGDANQLQPELITLARQRELSIPLALPVERAGPAALALPEEPQTIVVLYVRRKVVGCYHFADGELTAERVAALLAAAERLVAPQP
jgi:hypothetical protein